MNSGNKPTSGITSLLKELLDDTDGASDTILLVDVLDRFQRRAFGVFLLLVNVPSYIPVAFGIGAISGSLTILCGLQMLAGFEKPWLPKFARSFSLKRKSIAGFIRSVEKPFRILEKIIKPRFDYFCSRNADRVTGLIIIIMGVALSLPIPLTNFFFAVPLTVLALALIERDGLLTAICALVSTIVLIAFVWLGDAFVTWALELFK